MMINNHNANNIKTRLKFFRMEQEAARLLVREVVEVEDIEKCLEAGELQEIEVNQLRSKNILFIEALIVKLLSL